MKVVIVGAGLAAASAAEELRSQGHDGEVTLVGAEPHRPYERPPLSKAVLLGDAAPESAFVHDQGWYDEHDIDLRLGAPVTELDLDGRRVAAGGHHLSYDRLLIATGAAPRTLPAFEGLGPVGSQLRTLDDAVALRPRLAGEVLIVGAGWIGLEVASAARHAGARVTVVDPAPLPLFRVLGAEVARVFADLHRDHGVDLRLETSVAEVRRAGAALEVTLSDGHRVRPDHVVVAVGVQPVDDLAARAGLATDGGVLVDGSLRTSDPHVLAAGDVAHHDHPVLGRRVRVEHWDTAIHQGRHAARVMLGSAEPYRRLPYFFTDQYDLGMEYVGAVGPEGYDDVVLRGDVAQRVFTAFWIRGDEVVAGMHVNDWDAIDDVRRLVGGRVDDRLRDPRVPLADLTA